MITKYDTNKSFSTVKFTCVYPLKSYFPAMPTASHPATPAAIRRAPTPFWVQISGTETWVRISRADALVAATAQPMEFQTDDMGTCLTVTR